MMMTRALRDENARHLIGLRPQRDRRGQNGAPQDDHDGGGGDAPQCVWSHHSKLGKLYVFRAFSSIEGVLRASMSSDIINIVVTT